MFIILFIIILLNIRGGNWLFSLQHIIGCCDWTSESYSPPSAESSTVENGKLACPASEALAEAKAESDADGTKQAFLSLEPEAMGGAKASVLEVFKKVKPRPVQVFACVLMTSSPMSSFC